jgi:hypothetical protein
MREEPLESTPDCGQSLSKWTWLTYSIGHIVKFSLRPQVCDAVPKNVMHNALTDVLSLSFLDVPSCTLRICRKRVGELWNSETWSCLCAFNFLIM